MRKRDSFLPPQDGREWMTVKQAAEMLNMDRCHLRKKVKAWEFTMRREAHYCAPMWLLRSEIEGLAKTRAFRQSWLKRHPRAARYPRYTEEFDLKLAQEIFISAREAAVILGVCVGTVSSLVRRGRLVSYQSKPGHRGAKLWFSRRAVEQLNEDEERARYQAAYKKGKAGSAGTGLHGQHMARNVRVKIPDEWLTTREAAELLGVHPNRLRAMRETGRIRGEQLWGRKKVLRFWYFPLWEVEKLLADEAYLAARAQWQAREAKKRAGSIEKILVGNNLVKEDFSMLHSRLRPVWADERPGARPDWADEMGYSL